MLYLSGCLPSKPDVVAQLRTAPVGVMMQPGIGYSADTINGWQWAADNGCFNAKWNAETWLAWLTKRAGLPGCLFAVVPDVVGDHTATLERWGQWWRTVAQLGYRPAFVAQNGCTVDTVPWDECGAVFLGGDTAYKIGEDARRIVAEANRRGIWAHMGRVNSLKRLRIAVDFGCDSADGTFLAFGPDANTPRLVGWLDALRKSPSLFARTTHNHERNDK